MASLLLRNRSFSQQHGARWFGAYQVFFSWRTEAPSRTSCDRRSRNRWTEPIFGIASGREMKHITKLLWQPQQFDHVGAQFFHFIIVRRKLDGAVGLIISFCPRPPRCIWISFRF